MKENESAPPGGNGQPNPNTESEELGWHAPLPETLPKPTGWPAVLALGACLLAWGLVTSWIISTAGFVLFAVGCAGWISDLRHQAGP